MDAHLARRNRFVLIGLVAVVAGMVGLSFAAVPLYDLFCRVTGFGGTTQRAEAFADRVLDRTVTVRFNADVNQDLPWAFQPDALKVEVKVGEPGEMVYRATNLSKTEALVGTATYNVTPDKAGIFFNKVQCFCFTEQVLQPGQTAELPVQFFVDPAIADDPNTADVQTITLSYTFFRAADQSAAKRAVDGGPAKDYQESRPATDGTGTRAAATARGTPRVDG